MKNLSAKFYLKPEQIVIKEEHQENDCLDDVHIERLFRLLSLQFT